MGIIDSLSAGYRFLGRRLELLLVPVLLDLILWLGPRFSIEPLFSRLADFYTRAAALQDMPQDIVELSNQVSTLLVQMGEDSNLLEMVASTTLLHVPSLLVTLGPISSGVIFQIGNPLAAFVLFGGFGLMGILLGVLYLNLLAVKLPLGGPKPATPGGFVAVVMRQWLLVLVFLALVVILIAAGSIPMLAGTALLSLISPALGSFFMLMLSGAIMVLFFYLYFVTAALVVDNLPLPAAVRQSFVLVRNNFWSTLGFIVLTNLISLGISLIINRLTLYSSVGIFAAIVIHAYIGSGLAMAFLVFYRTRIINQPDGVSSRQVVGE